MSNTKVTERDTKAAILAAYEKLNAENSALRAELAILKAGPRVVLAPNVLKLRAQCPGLEGPWEKLSVSIDKSRTFSRVQLAKECFQGKTRMEAMDFMSSIAEAMELRGHTPVFKGGWLKVILKKEEVAPPPSDSIPDEPCFDDDEDPHPEDRVGRDAVRDAERRAEEAV